MNTQNNNRFTLLEGLLLFRYSSYNPFLELGFFFAESSPPFRFAA